jgi:two-component system, LytTR family, response regulator
MENFYIPLNTKIAVPILNGFEIINIDDIVRCEADRNYSKVFCMNSSDKMKMTELIVSRILKDMCEILVDQGFLRIHHSHLINPIYIKKVLKSEGGMVEMVDGTKIKITQNKEVILHKIFKQIRKV